MMDMKHMLRSWTLVALFCGLFVFGFCAPRVCGNPADETSSPLSWVDLRFGDAPVRVAPAECVVTPWNEALRSLLASDVIRGLLSVPAFSTVVVYPPPYALAEPQSENDDPDTHGAGGDGRGPEAENGDGDIPPDDLLGVRVLFTGTIQDPGRISERVLTVLRASPYVLDAWAIDSAAADAMPGMRFGLHFGVRLSPTDVALPLWRVSAEVVARRYPVASARIPNRTPLWVTVRFGLQPTAEGAAGGGFWQRIPLSRQSHSSGGLAVGFLPREDRSETVAEGTVSIDPEDAVAEHNEENNSRTVKLRIPPPPVREDLFADPDSAVIDPVVVRPLRADPNLPVLLMRDSNQRLREQGLEGTVSLTPAPRPANATGENGRREENPGPEIDWDFVLRLVLSGENVPEDGREGDGGTETDAGPPPAFLRALNALWYVAAARPLASLGTDDDHTARPVQRAFRIGVRLDGEAEPRGFWRVSATVGRNFRLGFGGWLDDPGGFLRPVTVPVECRIVYSEERILVISEPVVLGPWAARRMRFFAPRPAAVAALEGRVTIDPENAVGERNEENNTAGFEWHAPPEPEPVVEDLLPVPDAAQHALVDCTASVNDPLIPDLLRAKTINVLAPVPGFLGLQVYKWHPGVLGIRRFVVPRSERDFDFVLFCFSVRTDASDELPVERLVAALEAEWYVGRAFTARPGPLWKRLLPDGVSADIVCRIVLVDLAETDAVRRYWRIALPVGRTSARASSGRGGQVGPFMGWFPRFEDPSDDPGGAHPPEGSSGNGPASARTAALIAVDFQVRFAAAAGDAEGDDGANTSSMRNYVRLLPDSRTVALGLCSVDEREILHGTARVDPGNTFRETDEDNNVCRFEPPVSPPAPLRLRATARWTEDPEDGENKHLEVTASLRNPSRRTITISFSTSLQLDFTVGGYQWSADKFFAQVVSTIDVAPGASCAWTLAADAGELAGITPGTPIDVFLHGTEYGARVPFPGDDEGAGDPPTWDRDPEPPEEIIVTPEGVDLGELLNAAGVSLPVAAGDALLGGLLGTADTPLFYRPLSGFGGDEFVDLLVGEGDREAGETIRLKVGIQTFKERLQTGWNLISFPIVPVDDVSELLAQVPAGMGWVWENGTYEPLSRIVPGQGVWLFSAEDVELEYMGEPGREEDAPDAGGGWQLIGTVNPRRVDERQPGSRRPSAYRWGPGGYRPVDRIRSGEACWVFVEPSEGNQDSAAESE